MSLTWIEASAGTGKTYTLVKTVVDMVVQGLTVDRILLVTFTDKATAELKTRIRRGLRDEWKKTGHERLARALEDLPSLAITTIHGFCRALLTQFPLESGVSFEPEMVDQGRRWRQLLRDEVRPRLAGLDAALLAWAGLEDEEELLALAGQALNANVFSLPLVHPDGPERQKFQDLRSALENRTGPVWDAVNQASGLNLPADSRQAFGDGVDRFLHARNHLKPYEAVRQMAQVKTFRDLAGVLRPDTVEALAKWDEGGSLWKKAAEPPFEGTLEAVRQAAIAFADTVRHLESGLAEGLTLGAFLRRSARYAVLADLCLPVLDQRSDRELTYHDLIDRVHRLVTGGAEGLVAGARNRWQAVLIDEFQDTDPEQWAIFSTLFLDGAHDLVLVGDPKQSIYRFRGADLGVYRAVRNQMRTRGARFSVLEENFRSTAPMIEEVNRIFDPASGAPWEFADDFHPSRKGDKPIGAVVRPGPEGPEPLGPMARWSAGSERDWHRHLVATTLSLLDGTHRLDEEDRPLHPGDILILVRKKYEAWALYRLLTARGIPATVGGSGGLLRGREAQDVLLFLKALESPRSVSAARALGWTRLFAGATVDQLAPALDEARDDRDRGAFLRAFRRVAAALEPGVTDGGGLEALIGQPGGAQLVTNAEHVLELVQERYHRGDVAPGQAALALETWIDSKLQEDEVDLRRWGESPTVKLMTIHAAKGLEAPVVLHGWPSKPKVGDPDWIVADGVDFLLTAAGRAAEERNAAAEDLRLQYVALTRARAYQVIVDNETAGVPAVPVLPPEGWAQLPSWEAPTGVQNAVPPLGDAVEGLEGRHPWVESHSGLWRRATRDEAGSHTVWDRPRVRRDDETEDPELTSWADTLPAGPAFGDLIHDVLEQADWRAWAPGASPEDRATLNRLVEDHCQRQRASFQGKDWSRAVGAWLGRVLNQPLALGTAPPVTFTTLGPQDTRRELEFHLPLAHRETGTFAWGGRELVIHPGFLTGRIDLLFRWDGKLYLADWKTNRLGPAPDLKAVMADAGYDLQAQWYWEALRRLCRLQGEGLEPGGVLYVFLRGTGDRPLGVFLDPEHLDAQTALSALLPEVHHG